MSGAGTAPHGSRGNPWNVHLLETRGLTPEVLDERLPVWATHPHPGIRSRVATHPCTPAATLGSLVADPDVGVAARAVHHPRVPVAAVAQVAGEGRDDDPDFLVQFSIAHNPAVPSSIGDAGLSFAFGNDRLLKRRLFRVGEAMAGLHAMSAILYDLFHRMSQHPDPAVRSVLVRYCHGEHPHAASTGAALVADPDRAVRGAVAETTWAPEVLRLLAADPEAVVRRRVARNPRVPADVLTRLVQDTDARTRDNASSTFLIALGDRGA